MAPMTLYYDGGCNLCHESQVRAVRWAKKAGRQLRALPLQSQEAMERGLSDDAMVLEQDGHLYVGREAWYEILAFAPWYLRWLHWAARVPGIRQLMGLGYEIVARNRKKWFGSRACTLPSKRPAS